MDFEVDTLPENTRVPSINLGFDTTGALQGLQVSEKNALFVVQKTADGAAEYLKRYPCGSESEAIRLFGRGSMGHIAVKSALETYSSGSYFAIAVENKGTAAQGAIEITGTASQGGQLRLTIGQELVTVVIKKDDTASQIKANLLAALNDELLSLEVIPEAVETGITLTAKCAGENGNTIGITSSINRASGISVNISQMGNGEDSINPQALFKTLAKSKNNIVSYPYAWDTTSGSGDFANLVNYIDKVSDPIEQNSAIAVTGYIGDRFAEEPSKPEHFRIAFVNIRKADFTVNAMNAFLSADILMNPDPAVPLNGDEAPASFSPNADQTDYLREEQEILLREGITPLQITSGGKISVVRLISSKTTGVSKKVPDMWVRSLDFVREAVRNRVEAAKRKKKDIQKNVLMVKGEILGVLLELEEAEIVKEVRRWASKLTVERDTNNPGFFTAEIPADAIIGLHGVNGMIKLYIS